MLKIIAKNIQGIRMNFRQKLTAGSIGLMSVLTTGNIFHSFEPSKIEVKTPIINVDQIQESTELKKDNKRNNNLKYDAETLNKLGYDVNADDLATLTGILYYETFPDPAIRSTEEQRESLEGVANVILNRYLFDTCDKASPIINVDCDKSQYDGDKGLRAIVLKKNINKNTGNIEHQFSCVNDHKQFFNTRSEERQKIIDGYHFNHLDSTKKSAFDSKIIRLAYESLLKVLSHQIKDPTNGALSYKNTNATNKLRGRFTKWNGKQVFTGVDFDCSHITQIPDETVRRNIEKNNPSITCRTDISFVHDWVKKIGSHDFYTVTKERKETIFDNNKGHRFDDGIFNKRLSYNKQYRD